MWGQTFVEYSMHRNFNVGFSSHKNDIHLHLSQWQYWWWFWFALIWSLYFLVILRAAILGTENYKNTMNTSLRSHGKWGDFLVALIPLSWCGNILINSNFILRMIEWQNESSLFVVRIQGKQWYWVYKYNSDTNYRLQNVYINVGNNNWYKTSNQGSVEFNTHNSTLIFIYEYEFKKIHKNILEVKGKVKNELNNLIFNSQFTKYNTFNKTVNVNYNNELTNNFILNKNNIDYLVNKFYITKNIQNSFNKMFQYSLDNNINQLKIDSYTKLNLDKLLSQDTNFLINNLTNKKFNYVYNSNSENLNFYENDKLEEVEETLENLRTKVNNFPIKLIKGTLNKHNVNLLNSNNELNKNILFSYRTNNDHIVEKISQIEQFWGFRQKKYKKLRSFTFSQNYKFNNKSYQPISNFTNKENFNKYNLYTSEKNNKSKNETISVTLARRLLRTKRTLVLPAHINITIITSSYDVVHSWFIPGLGLKVDCVPGRSNHLTLYIDNIGFYYGQCAEICGRYHHHMPIRVCALNYEHFLLWWQTKGLPRMYRSANFIKKKSILLNKFK